MVINIWKWRIFGTKVDTENRTFFNNKTVCVSGNHTYCKCAVNWWCL